MRNIDSKSRPRTQFRFKYLAVRVRLLRLGGSLTTFSTVSTQSGHRLPLPNSQPKPVSCRFLSLEGDNEAARLLSGSCRFGHMADRGARAAGRPNARHRRTFSVG